jgi:hypothetical protein
MFFALVNTLEYSNWCVRKEICGSVYSYNEFMKEYLSTKGSPALRWNVPVNEQAGLVPVSPSAGWWEYSWIALKPGWSVVYRFSKA